MILTDGTVVSYRTRSGNWHTSPIHDMYEQGVFVFALGSLLYGTEGAVKLVSPCWKMLPYRRYGCAWGFSSLRCKPKTLKKITFGMMIPCCQSPTSATELILYQVYSIRVFANICDHWFSSSLQQQTVLVVECSMMETLIVSRIMYHRNLTLLYTSTIYVLLLLSSVV